MNALRGLERNAADLDRVLAARYDLIRQARDEGATWARIGEALGLRAQSAHRWYTNTPATRRAQR